MKRFFIFVFLLFFLIPGCTFLRGGTADDPSQDESYDSVSEDDKDEFAEEDKDEFAGDDKDEFAEEDEDEFAEEDEDEFAEEDEFAGEDEDEFAEDEDSGERDCDGFFKRLFSFGACRSKNKDIADDDEFFEDEAPSDSEGEEEFSEPEDRFAEDEEPLEGQVAFASEDESAPEESATASPASEKSSPPVVEKSPPPEPPTQEKPSKPQFISLKKIKSTPYRKAGFLVNAVYVVRPEDNLEAISQKIYGDHRVEDLYKINPHFRSRSVKIGDKVYYNSPFRKEDASSLLFYYQDINAPSSTHTLYAGDNIRTVASQLLGHPDSWKEIWATNMELQSKGVVNNTINIVYWPVGSEANLQPSQEPPSEPAPPLENPLGDPPEGEMAEMPPLEEDKELGDLPPVNFSGKNEKKNEVIKKPLKPRKPSLLQQKKLLFALLIIIIAGIFGARIVFKKRNHKEFDYTSTNIEV